MHEFAMAFSNKEEAKQIVSMTDKGLKEVMPDMRHPNLLPPKLRDAFHGLGAARYSSPEAQKLFAKSLLVVSKRLFWGPLAALLAFGFNATPQHFVFLCVTTLVCFGASAYARHYALVIYDTLPPKKRGSRKPKLVPAVESKA